MQTRFLWNILGAAGLVALAPGCVGSEDSGTSRLALTGAIFTSLVDGSSVNENLYDAKEDVYLDGGPGGNAPPGAAALPEGDYYFQVTDPSGMTLLSSDDIACRSFHVGADGVIDSVDADSGCSHLTGIDGDHADLGAITVQLMPYDDTPNPGGEYKVWVTDVLDYVAGTGVHGFVHADTVSDNFKVEAAEPPPPEPSCGDGTMDEGEECDDGNMADDDGCSANCTDEAPPPEPFCGDGTMDEGEQCDDGNQADDDGCSANCTDEPPPPDSCGDGTMDPGEECDDGNLIDHDGCSSECTTGT
jgi:cysteine-rich repeat protein